MASDFQTFTRLVGKHLRDPGYRSEVEEEILDHLELAAADLETEGLSPEEARVRAMAAFGDPALVGRLLLTAGKGGRRMKLARFGGACGILAGLFLALVMGSGEAVQSHLLNLPFWFRAAHNVVAITMMPLLFLTPMAITYLRQPGSRLEKGLLLSVQMAGAVISLVGIVLLPRIDVVILGEYVIGAGMALGGLLLAVRRQPAGWKLGAAMLVAGLGLPLLSPPLAFQLNHALSTLLWIMTAAAWIGVGYGVKAHYPQLQQC